MLNLLPEGNPNIPSPIYASSKDNKVEIPLLPLLVK